MMIPEVIMEKKRETDYFGKERISLLMVRFCIPCVLSLLVSALYNIVAGCQPIVGINMGTK